MKKRVFATVLSLVVLLAFATVAFAETSSAEWDVTFTAENSLDSNFDDQALRDQVHDLQPGDSITLTLNLANRNSEAANWYMSNAVLASLEDTKGTTASGGAYEYELIYTGPTGEVDVLFSSDAVGGEQMSRAAEERQGLKGATEALEDFLYLDTLDPGQEAVVTLRVSLDGETQGNAYQDTLARLQLNFAVDPAAPGEIIVRKELNIVQTGDQNTSMPFLIAAGISGLLLLVLALLSMHERKEQQKRKKRRAARNALCLMLATVVAVATPALAMTARADSGDTYVVRLYPGAQGSIADAGAAVTVVKDNQILNITPVMDGDICVLNGVPYGARVTFRVDPEIGGGVALNGSDLADSKYYVKGVRESGQDNSIVNAETFTVTGDQDYVVAYGIRGEMVAYTIHFEDEAGNELAPPVVRHGNIGDKPVVAYQYIEGYRPQAYNLTKTLSENADENVFTFVYDKVEAGTIVETVVETVVTVTPAPGVETPGGTAEPGGTTPEEEVLEGDTPLAPPEEIIDLDKTPLAPGIWNNEDSIIGDFATALMGLSMPARVGLCTALIALGVLVILLFVLKKRKKNDAKAS